MRLSAEPGREIALRTLQMLFNWTRKFQQWRTLNFQTRQTFFFSSDSFFIFFIFLQHFSFALEFLSPSSGQARGLSWKNCARVKSFDIRHCSECKRRWEERARRDDRSWRRWKIGENEASTWSKKCEKLLVFCCEWDNTTHTREWSLLPIWMVHREMRNDHKRAQSSHKIAAAKNYPTTCWSLFMEPSSAALASTKALNANGVIVGALEIVFFLESNSRNAQFPCAQVFTINSLDSHSLRAPENFFLISFNSQKKLWALSHLSLGLTRLSRAKMTTR